MIIDLMIYHIARADQYLAFGMVAEAIPAFRTALIEANKSKRLRSAGHILVAIRCCHQALRS